MNTLIIDFLAGGVKRKMSAGTEGGPNLEPQGGGAGIGGRSGPC
jgi:hypothetical protein